MKSKYLLLLLLSFIMMGSSVYATDNFIYFYDTTSASYISNFNVFSASNGINRSSSGIFINISGSNLTNGSTTFSASLVGYVASSATFTVDTSTAFNITLNTTQTNLTFAAFDEITKQQLPFSMNMYLKGTNTTLVTATAYRKGSTCFFDGLEIACLSSSGACLNSSTIQAFDNNIGTFKAIYSQGNISPVDEGTFSIYINKTKVSSINITGGNATHFTFYVPIDNLNGIYSKAANLTIEACTSAGNAQVYEFKLFNTTSGYTYIGTTNNTIQFPILSTIGFTTVDTWITADPSYLTDYTTPRMYRLSFSPYTNFNFNAYLLNDTLGYLQYFTVLDPNNAPLTNALITIQNWYSGIATTVVQCASNPTGSCAVFVKKYNEYQLIGQLTGYNTIQRAIVFTGLPNPANLYMTGNVNVNYTSIFDKISIAITPTIENQNQSFNTTCSILASLGNLNFMNYTIYRVENNTFYQYNSTYSNAVPSGSAFKMPILARGHYSAQCILQWVSNATGITTTYQTSYQQKYWNFQDKGQGIGSQAVDSIMGMGIYILLILVVCVPLSRISGGLAMLAGIGILAAAAFTEIFTWNTQNWLGVSLNLGWELAGLTILVVVAIFTLRNRI